MVNYSIAKMTDNIGDIIWSFKYFNKEISLNNNNIIKLLQ